MMPLVLSVLSQLAGQPQPALVGGGEFKPYTLVKLSVKDVPPKTAVMWKVYPAKGVQRADTDKLRCQFVAPPGTYEVSCLLVTTGDNPDISELTATVTILEPPSTCPPVPPAPPAPGPAPGRKANPEKAILKLNSTAGGCTACPVAPQLASGKWHVLTAAHCVRQEGESVKLTSQTGKVFSAKVVAMNTTADLAWLETDDRHDDIEFAELAKATPQINTNVWQAGYGLTTPGVRKDGTLISDIQSDGKLVFNLLVNSGDSGGPVFDANTGEVLAAVCCTAQPGAKTSMRGGSWQKARELRPKATQLSESAVEIPIIR